MPQKTVNFTRDGISKLPNDKPVVYKIVTAGGKNNYTGITKRGRVQERLQEHLKSEDIPGVKVQIQQMKSIGEAAEKEDRIIKRSQPKYNKKGK